MTIHYGLVAGRLRGLAVLIYLVGCCIRLLWVVGGIQHHKNLTFNFHLGLGVDYE